MALLRALLYLRFTTIANLVRGRLRRLRQPKYFVGAIAGALYFWFFFFRGTGRGNPGHALALAFGEGRAEYFAAAILSLFVLLIWVLPGEQPGLAFTEAEVAFLFPAPLTRRQLIHYKLLDGLLTSLVGAMFFTLISIGLRNGWLGALQHLGAWWALNANLSLHQSAAALTIAWISRRGLSTAWRRGLLLGWLVAFLAALVFVAVRYDPALLKPLLWPARLVVRPFLAGDPVAYGLALLPAFGLMAVHYFWVHRMESPFEDASIVLAQKTAEVVARMRAGKGVRLGGTPAKARREPFRLGPHLPVEAALLWKNLMMLPPYLNRKVFLGAAAVIGIGIPWLQRHPDFGGPKLVVAIGVIAVILLGYLFLVGPQLARNDLRSDLLHADELKGWPLPGWRVVLGGLLAPTVLLTAIAWLLLLAAGLAFKPPGSMAEWLTPSVRIAVAGALAAVMPALCAVQLLVPNAATLLFPAWSQTGRPAAGGGMDVMGQRMIFFAGQFICLLFALIPAAVAGSATIFLTGWVIGYPAAVLLAAVPVLLIISVEVWLGVHWVGLRFEALDISAELRP